ncbi:MAG: lysophospholipid acyltransferase family protein [Actinomycetota bacterium]
MTAERAPVPGPADATPAAAAMGPGARIIYRVIRSWIWVALKLVVRVDISGRDRVPTTGGFILAPGGHRSILDTPLASLASPRVLRYMGAETYFNIPGLGFFLRSMGGFPVERSMTDRLALRLSEEVLRNGEPLVVFPEGTRQEGPIVQPLKEGAAFLACRAGVPIVPVGLGGTQRAMPKGARYIRPRRVTIIVGEPIHPPARPDGARVKRSAVTALSDELRDTLQDLFDQAQIKAGA